MRPIERSYVAKTKRICRELARLIFVVDSRTYLRFLAAMITSTPDILHTKNLSTAYRKMWGRPCVFTVEGHTIVLDGRWFGYAVEVYCLRPYFALPAFEIRSDMRVLDLGASSGIFTVLAASLGAEVIAVEANRIHYAGLLQNVERNRVAHRVHSEWALVGSGSGTFGDGQALKTLWGDDIPSRLSVQTLLDRYGWNQIDFLKVDIEGSEYDLFTRDNNWLQRVRLLVTEVHNDFGDYRELVQVLREKEFEIWTVDDNQKLVPEINERTGYLFGKRHGG
jgi:FkbM family methyltransferase